jgi:GTP-dependent phosphoenolpyruvate carboxykinase
MAEEHGIEEYYAEFGDRVPQALRDELAALKQRLRDA